MQRGGDVGVEGSARSDLTTSDTAPRGTPAVVPESLARRRTSTIYDVVILGAGCAGLTSCLALLEAGAVGPILLIDSRTHYADDRTWCFWDVEATPFTHLARSSWDEWQVRTVAGTVTAAAPATPYLCLAANDFYTFALASIAKFGNVELRLDERAGEYREAGDVEVGGPANGATGDLVEVSTDGGTVWARELIDSRGLALSGTTVAAVKETSTWVPQQFVGLHIVATRPVFDPGECRLMDFAVDQSRGLRFMYVLPSSPFEALVENVYMSEPRLGAEGYQREIEEYLLAEFGLEPNEFVVAGAERGYIPMTDHRFARRMSARVTAAGMRGGATRPSTGYTFLGIQRSSRELADRLIRECRVAVGQPAARPDTGGRADVWRRPDAAPHARRTRAHADPTCSLLDAVFLRFLADHPERAPHVFALMFGRVDTASLVRFLTERSGALDHARLIIALPKLPFLRSAATVMGRRGLRALGTWGAAHRR
ncbi:hypothetical protein BHD05_05640 [Marisediminicola antarctica]|uniref:Lycopene cyclase n=1 Tax=Marisediminicola antarctica TaxID=674079 RepID=A0A7L5AG60_9MICO|nr:hypothetical protein BHD05_05640 [Marisediminicola antarctica]